MLQAKLHWIAEYAGPSPLGAEPLVVAELRVAQELAPAKAISA